LFNALQAINNIDRFVARICELLETAWVILNCAGGWLGYSILSMTAGVSTSLKPGQ
jgi:hypothetical protein